MGVVRSDARGIVLRRKRQKRLRLVMQVVWLLPFFVTLHFVGVSKAVRSSCTRNEMLKKS